MYDDLIKDKKAVKKNVAKKGNILRRCRSCRKYKAINVFRYDDDHDVLSEICDECEAKVFI